MSFMDLTPEQQQIDSQMLQFLKSLQLSHYRGIDVSGEAFAPQVASIRAGLPMLTETRRDFWLRELAHLGITQG
jgi:hypothetical protein